MNWKHFGWVVLTCLLIMLLGGPQFVMAKGAKSTKADSELYVSVKWLPLHAKPTGLSETKGIIGFGTAVKVLETVSVASGVREKNKQADWALVECTSDSKQGYAPMASLVNRAVLDREDPGQAMQKVSQRDVSVSGKGFSESEEGDLKAMKGAVGAASASSADEAAIDSILTAPQEYDPHTAYVDFRKEGKTGEYGEGVAR